jgi:hypothetical protein
MKKLVLVLMVAIFFSASAFCQNVSDYFPVTTGNNWTYANSTGNTTDIVTVGNSTPDRDGTMLYLFENQTAGLGATSTMYSIKNNKVVILVKKDILGRYHEQRQPFPVELAPAGQEWRQDDDGEYYLFKTSKASVKYDDKNFDDCILIEQRVFVRGSLYVTNRSYYAHGIGFVYKTLQSPGQSETVFKKLVSCNFADISIGNAANNLWEDIAVATLFFFRRLGEAGLGDVDNAVNGLNNDNQKAVFQALVTIKNNNLTTILNMFSTGNFDIARYLNVPIPDFLIAIQMGRRPVAVAVDKAIKIIALTSVLNLPGNRFNVVDQRLLRGTREAAPILSNSYQVDSSISNDVELFYSDFINMYLRYGGK